jgi:hypothetical protein
MALSALLLGRKQGFVLTSEVVAIWLKDSKNCGMKYRYAIHFTHIECLFSQP